jgi:hypothetical protein
MQSFIGCRISRRTEALQIRKHLSTQCYWYCKSSEISKEFWTPIRPETHPGNFPEGKRETFFYTFPQTKFMALLAKQDSSPKKHLLPQNLRFLQAKAASDHSWFVLMVTPTVSLS